MLENNLFWDVLIIISSTIELWACKKIFDYTSDKKFSNTILNTIMILIVLLMLILLKINLNPDIRIAIAMVLTSTFYILNYKTNFLVGIMTNLLYWMVLLGTDGLSMSIVIWVNSLDNMNMLLINNLYRLESILLGKGILLTILGIYKIVKCEIELRKKDILYLGIPILANISSFFLIFKYVFKFSRENLINESQILNISILLFLSNISIILVIKKIRKDSKLLIEKDIMRNNIDMQYKYYMNINENQLKMRQLYHDMKNHIICMKRLNECGYSNIDYIENIEDKLISLDNTFDTGNVLLDIILNEKKEVCNNHNIKFSCNINFTKCGFIDAEDVCSIFSNILDNAIEACEKINNNKRHIYLDGKIVNRFFILKAENTKCNEVNVKNNNFITNKKDKYLHGLGIKSIKESVKRYKGETVIDYSDDEFTMKILIPVTLD
ncbi:ATP-binding protein [Faecalimicrobium sp. JNUCC 81]